MRDLKWRKSYHLVIYWSFCFLDAKGRPGGLVRGSSNSMKLIHSFSQNVGIQRQLGSKEQGKVFSIIDLYGLYDDRKIFWDNFKARDLDSRDKVIVGGDLHLTLKNGEVWRESVRQDPLVDYFSQMFEDLGRCDVEPIQLVPAWRNLRSGKDGVSKRLERFLVAEKLLEVRRMKY